MMNAALNMSVCQTVPSNIWLTFRVCFHTVIIKDELLVFNKSQAPLCLPLSQSWRQCYRGRLSVSGATEVTCPPALKIRVVGRKYKEHRRVRKVFISHAHNLLSCFLILWFVDFLSFCNLYVFFYLSVCSSSTQPVTQGNRQLKKRRSWSQREEGWAVVWR